LYADDLVVIAETEEDLIKRLNEWKDFVENRGMRVNMNKARVVISGERQKVTQKAVRYPCGVCGRGVGNSSIQCTSCRRWVHGRCSGIKGGMYKVVKSFVCGGCVNPVTGTGRTGVDIGGDAGLELVDGFCYLGDVLGVDGDADAAVETGVRVGWRRFRRLVPLLASRDISLTVRGRLCSSCVRSSMLHGSEAWPVGKEGGVALRRAELGVVGWMCGVRLQDRVPSKELRGRLELEDIISVLQRNGLRWCGHVLRREDGGWVRECMEYEVEGTRPRGRPKKIWRQIVEKDCRARGLNGGGMPWIVLDGES